MITRPVALLTPLHTSIRRHAHQTSRLLLGTLCALSMAVSGCQPNSNNTSASASNNASVDNDAVQVEPDLALTPSAVAKASIDKYQADYVNNMLNLQQSQQAEFDALQAADRDLATLNTKKTARDNVENIENEDINDQDTSDEDTSDNDEVDDHNAENEAAGETTTDSDQTLSTIEDSPAKDATEVSLETLPLADTSIPPPQMLSRDELESRYTSAMQALYLPDETPLPAGDMDTLLSIATVIPDVFKNDELARRLVVKSPALARLLRQYQIWEQIEAQQSSELEALSQAHLELQEAQTKEFERLVADFDKTIQGYDEQIAKYEKLLKELN